MSPQALPIPIMKQLVYLNNFQTHVRSLSKFLNQGSSLGLTRRSEKQQKK